jgi:hypothetical protein
VESRLQEGDRYADVGGSAVVESAGLGGDEVGMELGDVCSEGEEEDDEDEEGGVHDDRVEEAV